MNEHSVETPDPIDHGHHPKSMQTATGNRFVPSPSQSEIWLSSKSGAEASCAYNDTYLVRLVGDCDERALLQSLAKLAHRHPVLRGHYTADGSAFIVNGELDIDVAAQDLSALPPDEQEDAIQRLVQAEQTKPCVLEVGPLYHPSLLRLGPREYVVLLAIHQAACDDWAIDIVLRDLAESYRAEAARGTASAQVGQSVPARSEYRSTSPDPRALEVARNFWRQQFETLPLDLELPRDGRRSKFPSLRAHHSASRLGFDLREGLEAFATAQGLDVSAVCLAAFAVQLYRTSGVTDFVVGVPVPQAFSADGLNCVGQFSNLVPLRCVLRHDQSFLDCCREVDSNLRQASQHSCVGYGQIVSDVQASRDSSRHSLASIVFSHRRAQSIRELCFGNCKTEFQAVPRSNEIFEFSLSVIDCDQSLTVSAYAHAELYSREWLRRRLGEFEQLLRDGCGSPTKPVARLRLLDFEQYGRLCQYSSNFGQRYPREALANELFEAQVAKTPEATAVRFGNDSITYLGLEQRANQVAHLLGARGVGRGKFVGLCLRRGIDMVVAVLATLKTGAAYVPLDPMFPPARLRHMIDDSEMCLVVSESSLAEHHACPGERTLNLDELANQISAESIEPLERGVVETRSTEPAYLIYTSGSTGLPKGVCVPHRALVNFLTSMQSSPGLTSSDRVLAVTTLSFDIAVLELLLPLSVGAEIVLASREDAVDGDRLLQLLQKSRATLMQATPVSWRLLLEAGWRGSPDFKVLCGGEPLPLDLAEELVQRVGQLWNMYGPTETTVWSTCGRVFDPRRGITIGRPINNTSVWILDSLLQPCPIGVPGEIHIGGDGLALGYLKRPELTRERFVPNPYETSSSSRLYKTGDIGRWLDGGELECLGRTDSQVKIRGYRIELGEIEAALGRVRGVRKAAVAAKGPSTNAKLVGYLVVDADYIGDGAAREALKNGLPDYMLPAMLVHLQELPLTPNGKLDRKALPDAAVVAVQTDPIELPADELEQELFAIWQVELGQTSFGVTSDFFEIGGHSLMAIRIFNAIYHRYSIRLHIATLVEYPTVRRLARRIRDLMTNDPTAVAASWSTIVPMQTRGELPPLFCIAGLGGNPLNLRFLCKALRANQPFYGVQHRGVDGVLAPHRSIEAMADEVMNDVRRIQPRGPYYFAGYSTGGVIAYELARLMIAHGAMVGAVILLDSYNPTCLTWPLGERIRAHANRLRSVGLKYIVARASSSLERGLRDLQRSARSLLPQAGSSNSPSFEHREETVVQATIEAERAYVPQPIAADVYLVQTDFSIPELDGIGYPPHESNGWRAIDRGNLSIVQVKCNHEDLVAERVAPTTGSIVRHILRTAQAKRAEEEPPPPSLMPDWLTKGTIPYYVPKEH